MKTLKSLAILFGVGLFLLSSSVRADEWDKETKITFSGPVRVANTQLSPGTYTFRLADTMDRHIVQIFNEDGTQIIATIMATPDSRLQPTGDTEIRFAEASDGSEASGTLPESGIPIKEWFYPGDDSGQEFRVVSNPPVAAVQPEGAAAPTASSEPRPESLSAAAAPEPPAAASPEPQAAGATSEAPAAQEAPAAPQQSTQSEPAAEQPATPARLPQTASQLPLVGLIGIISLAAAASFRIIMKRWA